MSLNMKLKSVKVHDFSMIPRAEIPRSSFPVQHNHKLSMDFSDLVPIFVAEVLPGDHWNVRTTIVARTATPLVPVMDNWHLETFAFFTANRLVWQNWERFNGAQDNPTDPINYTIPQIVSPVGGHSSSSLYDFMGIPCVGQLNPGSTISTNALPMRCYNLIYNQWFRDENLQNSAAITVGDGPDTASAYIIQRRGKRHDYFTACLPWPQKGTTAVTLPLGSTAPVIRNSATATPQFNVAGGGSLGALRTVNLAAGTANITTTSSPGVVGDVRWNAGDIGLMADLSTATAATINQIRLAFQTQRLLERDARGGTRYTEIIRAHFGVVSPDARLQRPEYIGGGHVPINLSAIPQTSATGLTGGSTPAGNLAATGHAQGTNGFSYAATEHGYIIVLASARADLTYNQGLARMWTRLTRYDFYLPVFAMLGEQTVLNREIYCTGGATDTNVFGYQERWAEYRYMPSRISGLMKTYTPGNISYWHSAQQFGALPTLNSTFIQDDSKTVLQRNFAGGAATLQQQLILDVLFTGKVARPMPAYSVPGMIDHF